MQISIKTPLIESVVLSQITGSEVWLKMEALQPSGSFKLRGIAHACQKHIAQGAQRFICSSGGNAGLAVAYTGRKLQVPVIVVVPKTTSERAKLLIAQQGADVIVHGDSWFEANDLALSMLQEHDQFIHPFDDALLWEGISVMIDEVIEEGIKPDAVVLSVGGGSLLSGVALGLARHQLKDVPIYAVETDGTASLHASMLAKAHVALDKTTGIATTLAANKVCSNAFQVSQHANVKSVVVSDQDTVNACLNFLDDHRILVEPACGASLSIAYDQKVQFKPTDKVLVIVCGGSGTTLDVLQGYTFD